MSNNQSSLLAINLNSIVRKILNESLLKNSSQFTIQFILLPKTHDTRSFVTKKGRVKITLPRE